MKQWLILLTVFNVWTVSAQIQFSNTQENRLSVGQGLQINRYRYNPTLVGDASIDPMFNRPDYAQLVYGMNNPDIPQQIRLNQIAHASNGLVPFLNPTWDRPFLNVDLPQRQPTCYDMYPAQVCQAKERIADIHANYPNPYEQSGGNNSYVNNQARYYDAAFGAHQDYYNQLLQQQGYVSGQ